MTSRLKKITFARNFRKAGVTMFGIRTNHINRASDCAGSDAFMRWVWNEWIGIED